jgi:cell wall-associated NlpC family hydrolase
MSFRIPLFSFCTAALIVAGCSGARETGRSRTTPRKDVPADVRLTGARKIVVQEAKRWLGTPYCYGGVDGECFDCSGFVTNVFRKIGVPLPRSARDMYGVGEELSASAIRPADLVFFRNTAGPGITHVGIAIGARQFIHASSSRGVIMTSLDDAYYRKHYAGARRVIIDAR